MQWIEPTSSTLISLLIGLGLSASCGFRVFVPPFIISLAALGGHLELSEPFAWMATLPAVMALGTALALEVAAYYLPLVDNLLDTVAAPAAIIAGSIVSASVFTDMSPVMKWSLALIAGGGVAGIVHASMALIRGGSTATTGGLGNPVIATAELGGAVGASLLSLLVPGLLLIAVLILAGAGTRIWLRRRTQVVPVGEGVS